LLYSISHIAHILHASTLQQQDDAIIDHLLPDSRKLLFPASSLFFALNGPRRSGKSFVADLYQKGVRNFIVDTATTPEDIAGLTEATVLVVDDVRQALQQLAAYHRRQFSLPIIGITGSNGKTIVKEWLFQLLHQEYNIVRSPKSYNSQTGVPLSVWQLQAQHTLGIFEAGISQPGEMQQLQEIIEPSMGIFTNIGEAHNEGFKSIQQKIKEKAKLFINSKVIVYCKDETQVDEAMQQLHAKNNNQLFSWGKNSNATLHIISIEVRPQQAAVTAGYNGIPVSITIPFTDDASIKNAITCWCVLLHMGIPQNTIAERMLQLKPVEMRLELKQGINNCSVINDSYSADITSLLIALDFLQQQQQHSKRTVIVSDILQSGKSSENLYSGIAKILEQKNIQRIIGIGTEISRWQHCFNSIAEKNFFNSTDELVKHFPSLHFHNESILLKGARMFEFETIAHLLEYKTHQTVLEINLNAITHNLKAYQQLLQPGVKLMAMVKAFSYGSGSFEIANLLQFHQIDYLTVAYADEGVELRKAGITLPIMIMNAEEATFDMLVQHNLEPELYSFAIMGGFESYLLQNGISNYPVHIKLDTGMHRLGFEAADMHLLCEKLTASAAFKIQSVFSHLAASDNPSHDNFTHQQATAFTQACAILEKNIPYSFLKHIANTSAIHRHPSLQLDMVRLGIGLYGVDGNPAMQQLLQNVSTLKTTIAQLKKVKAGESVGYNRSSIAQHDSVIATVRIGYADGYPRNLSNGKGFMWVNNQLAPVTGNICMDMTMLDVTGIDVQEGDDVIVFGEQLPVAQMAAWSGTIAYEILTGISQRVKRVYFEE